MLFVHRIFDEKGNNIKSQNRYDQVETDEGIICTSDSCPYKEKCYKGEKCPLFLYEDEWDKNIREKERRQNA